MNPLPLGTLVRIEIRHEGRTFAGDGTVAYSQHNMGMGILFEQFGDGQEVVLEKWLTELEGVGPV